MTSAASVHLGAAATNSAQRVAAAPILRPLRLFLVRHAQSVANVTPGVISGSSNHISLTPMGQRQTIALAQRWKQYGPHLHAIYSSTAVRAIDTCDAVCNILGYPINRVTRSERLIERDMDQWVGRNRQEAWTHDVMTAFQADPWNYRPGVAGESLRMVEERMMQYIEDEILPLRSLPLQTPIIGQSHQHENDQLFPREFGDNWVNVAIFGHGLAIKCVLRHVTGSVPLTTRRLEIDNTSITELLLQSSVRWSHREFHGGDVNRWSWKLRRMNDISHLTHQ